MLLLYINESRLLDICAMENNGFSEYEIYSNVESSDKTRKHSLAWGFKAIALGNVEYNSEDGASKKQSQEVKKIQTISSIFKNTLEQVKESCKTEEQLTDGAVAAGDYILIPVNLHLNSFTLGIEAFDAALKLYEPIIQAQSGNKPAKGHNVTQNDTTNAISRSEFERLKKEWGALKESLGVLIEFEEVYYEHENYAITGTIDRGFLYQSTIQGIVDMQVKCFAQIKEIRDGSTGFLKNTLYSKIDNIEQLSKPLEDFFSKGPLRADLSVKLDTNVQTIYELEIIGLYV